MMGTNTLNPNGNFRTQRYWPKMAKLGHFWPRRIRCSGSMGYAGFRHYVRTCPGHFWPELLGFTYINKRSYGLVAALGDKNILLKSVVCHFSAQRNRLWHGLCYAMFARCGLPLTGLNPPTAVAVAFDNDETKTPAGSCMFGDRRNGRKSGNRFSVRPLREAKLRQASHNRQE
nr:hypothetical protein [Marinicella sp. W31]MDC2875942.1 hypothetical protein [Marinicella sp. W31]